MSETLSSSVKLITEKQIENFYNKNKEKDVPWCKFENIPNSLKNEIHKILSRYEKSKILSNTR